MEKREALKILQELTTIHDIIPGTECPRLKYEPETYQKAVAVFEKTIVELEKSSDYANSLKCRIKECEERAAESEHKADAMGKMLESVTTTVTEESKEKTIYEELFNRIFRSGEPFSIQVGGVK